MTDIVRVTATGAGVSYYPEFLARELGYFADEDLDVQTVAPGHGPWVARALDNDEADIALGGIWRPLMYQGRLAEYSPFAQLCIACPTQFVSRTQRDVFAWTDVEGQDILVPDGAPSPWMLLRAVLRKNGVDLPRVRFIQDFMTEEATDLFKGGLADFYLVGPPTAEALQANGVGHIVANLADAGGPIPWSVYYSRPDFIEREDNPAGRFSRAIQRGLGWILTHEPEEAPGVASRHFPKLPAAVVFDSVRSCRARGVWTNDVHIDKAALAAWQVIIEDYGLIARPVEYDAIVDSRPADFARN